VFTYFLNITRKTLIHLANRWGGHSSNRRLHYFAREIARRQKLYPRCGYCYWPVLPNRPHALCDHELTHFWCYSCGEEVRIEQWDEHTFMCSDPQAEWEAIKAEEDAKIADEARMLEEKRAATEAYFAEQETERQREIAEAEEASWPEDDEPDLDEETGDECSICGSRRPGIDCGCEEGDPLAGDVDPVGGYPEEVMLVPSPNGGFEEITYDPTDPKQHPLAGYYEDDEDE
jgi:hypothetical protein